MNSKERVYARLEGQPVDRIPNLNILMQFAAKFIGVPYGKYATDYRSLVEGNIRCCREFGIDMVSAISDPFRETSGFGAEVIISYDDVPSVKNYLIRDYGDISRIKPADPLSSERMLDRINAVRLYMETAGKEYPILGWVEGPFAEACDLRGVNEMMIDLYDEPDFVNELLEICLRQEILFAGEQIKAGADFIGVGDAAGSLVGPRIYQETVLPFEKRLVQEIHGMGAKVKLHICGNTSSLLELMPLTGADIIDLDWMVDFKAAARAFGERVCPCGNFDPVTILLQGTPEIVKENVKTCIEAGGPKSFISAGCEVPKHTPAENMKAVVEAIAEYSK